MDRDHAALERKSRRGLAIVAIACLIVVSIAFVAAAKKSLRIRFSRGAWDSGKSMYTLDNPRLKMDEEIQARLSYSPRMSKKEVEDFLGPSEPQIAIIDPRFAKTGTAYATPGYIYLLGIRPKNMAQNRRVVFLHVTFGATGNVAFSYDEEIDYPPGSKIVVAKVLPALPMPATLVPNHKPIHKPPKKASAIKKP